jgi:steroid 5-alpha reductase family enzyme
MNALQVCLCVFAGVCLVCGLLWALTGEDSWVDRFWGLVPIGYTGIFAGFAGFTDTRLDVMFALVALWGARLTFNNARRGGYARGSEDHRVAALRERMTPSQFRLYVLFFITIYQNALILLIALPAWSAFQHRSPFGPDDVVITVLFLACLVGETVADQQQWDFHQWKHREREAGRTPQPGFLQTGLFRYSRHPNFFFEQAQWWLVFAFGAIAAGAVTWTIAGAVLLTLQFVGATTFTENISRTRYPEYAAYQRRTSPVVPWFPRRPRTLD